MRGALPFRICALILVCFAIGHTYGFEHFKPLTAEGAAVKVAMDQVAFPFGRAQRTYGDFYRGFGFFVTAYLIFAALLALELPYILDRAPRSFWVISIGFLCVLLCTAFLSWLYFALPQIILSALIVLCFLWGLLSSRKG